jgi:hypothetical protein
MSCCRKEKARPEAARPQLPRALQRSADRQVDAIFILFTVNTVNILLEICENVFDIVRNLCM